MTDSVKIIKARKGAVTKIVPQFKSAKNLLATANSKATSENTSLEVQNAFKKRIKELEQTIGRDGLLLLAAMKDSSIYARRVIVRNELQSGNTDKNITFLSPDAWSNFQKNAIGIIVSNIDNEKGIPQVLRLFDELNRKEMVATKNNMGQVVSEELVVERTNNSRTYGLMRQYLSEALSEFRAIKYRAKLKKAFRHILGKVEYGLVSELARQYIEKDVMDSADVAKIEKALGRDVDLKKACVLYRFITGDLKSNEYSASKFPVIDKYFKLKSVSKLTDLKELKNMPEEIYHGILSDEKHPLHTKLYEKVDNKAKSGKVIKKKPTKFVMKDDAKKLVLELAKGAMTADVQQRSDKRMEEANVKRTKDESQVKDVNALLKTKYEKGNTRSIDKAVKEKAKENKIKLNYNNILVVVDKTPSMLGDELESKNTPRATAEFSVEVFKASVEKTTVVTSGADIAMGIVEGLETNKHAEAVFVVSDGFETDYDGKVGEVISILQNDMNYENIDFFHINPVLAADGRADVKSFADNLFAIGVKTPMEIESKINMNKLELNPVRYFEDEFRKFLTLE